MIAFLDASAVIYLIEGKEPFRSRARKELDSAAKRHPDLGAAVSRLSWHNRVHIGCRTRFLKGSARRHSLRGQRFQQTGEVLRCHANDPAARTVDIGDQKERNRYQQR